MPVKYYFVNGKPKPSFDEDDLVDLDVVQQELVDLFQAQRSALGYQQMLLLFVTNLGDLSTESGSFREEDFQAAVSKVSANLHDFGVTSDQLRNFICGKYTYVSCKYWSRKG